jgi:hypothetical protein
MRMERLLIENAKLNCTMSDNLNQTREKIVMEQEKFKEDVQTASSPIKLDTSRLIEICIGLTTGVQRLDSQQIGLQKQVLCQTQQVVRYQKRSEAAFKDMMRSMQTHAFKTSGILSQLLHLYVSV